MEGKERNSGKQAARSARKEKGREWKKRRKTECIKVSRKLLITDMLETV